MCGTADFSLEMLDSHVKEYGVNCLDKVEVNGKTAVEHISNAGEDTPERREYQARLTVVRKDKKLIQSLTYEGKTGLYLHAICQNYYVTPDIIQFCLDEFGTDNFTREDEKGNTPLHVLAKNPSATEECNELFNLVNNIRKMCGTADFSLEMLDSHVKEYGVNCLDKVEVNGKTAVEHISNAGEDTPERREYQARLTVVRKDKKLIQSLTYEGKTGLYLHAVCQNYYVTPDIIQFCVDEFGTDNITRKDESGKTPFDVLARNPARLRYFPKHLFM